MNNPIRLLPVYVSLAWMLCYSASASAAPDCSNYENSSLLTFPLVNPVWEMCVRRSSQSTPQPNGSGLEVLQLNYNGHLVMERGNIPVLNVQYGTNGCGCFRDWMDSEAVFDALPTTCQATGICDVIENPATICDCAATNSCDADPNNACNTEIGEYSGIAVKRDLSSMSITTHLRAGWYRYTMQWVFHLDGSIEPKFKFGATPNGCTDASHMHHGYYRFDFDIGTANNDQFYTVSAALSGQDSDGDSIDNSIDNCTNTPNADQLDADLDGFGNRCDADFNNDNITNFADLFLFQQAFLSTNEVIDMNGDGTVNFGDLSLFASLFLSAPGPAAEASTLETPINQEMSAFAAADESWLVKDTLSGRGYQILPGDMDHAMSGEGGINDPEGFAVADYWVLNQNSSEMTDQGGGCATSLNNYVSGESTTDTDVVFWLRFGTHHIGEDECFCGLNGPRLVPVGDWSATN